MSKPRLALYVYVSQSEKSNATALAESLGVSLSDYVRSLIRSDLERRLTRQSIGAAVQVPALTGPKTARAPFSLAPDSLLGPSSELAAPGESASAAGLAGDPLARFSDL